MTNYTLQRHKLDQGSLEEGYLEPLAGQPQLFTLTHRIEQQIYWDGWAFTELDYNHNCIDLSSRYDRTAEAAMAMALANPDFRPIGEQIAAAKLLGHLLKELADAGKWRRLFELVDKRVGWLIFRREYARIPRDQVYDAFYEFYIRAEDGFEMIKDLYRPIFFQAKHSGDRKERLRELPDGEELTIYHGEQTPSIKDWYSWTLDRNCAAWFAGRWGKAGEVWKKTILKSTVVDYIFHKSEDEVLIDFALDPEYSVCEVVNVDPNDPFQKPAEEI